MNTKGDWMSAQTASETVCTQPHVAAARSPLTSSKGKSRTKEWLAAHVEYAGDDCLVWPFSRDPLTGRAAMGAQDGSSRWACRRMCELAKGAPPTPSHQAAHTCGRGHEGCINPKHLTWKTAQDNARDMIVHGTTRQKGEPRRKLTAEQVAQIRALGATHNQCQIAVMVGIGRHQVGKIIRGQAWPDRQRPNNRGFTPEQRLQMCEIAARMRSDGAAFQTIADHLDVSRHTARTMAEEHELAAASASLST